MHSEVFLLCIVALLPTAEAVKTKVRTSSDDITKSSPDSRNEALSRGKRWTELDTRSGYDRGYNPSSFNQRYMYPSNLMALLRGRRSHHSQSNWEPPSNLMAFLRGRRSNEPSGNWEAPSNLMTFLRGRRSYEPSANWEAPSNLMTLLRGRRSYEPSGNWEAPSNLMTLLRGRRSYNTWQAPSNLLALLRGKKYSEPDDEEDVVVDEAEDVEDADDIDSDISSKRSLYLDYSPRLSGGYFRPYGARQFMVWHGGRSILG